MKGEAIADKMPKKFLVYTFFATPRISCMQCLISVNSSHSVEVND